jgi:SAM-dependent methyltransferase
MRSHSHPHPAEEFFDAWADFYDDEYREQEIGDRQFYVDLARAADGPVLEAGCGTGRVYLELLETGVDATGIDVSRESLDVLERKAAERGLASAVDVRRADMRDFETDRAYALVVVPFRAFLHNVSLADQRAALERFRAALAPGGRLALSAFVPDFDVICESYGEPTTRTVEHEGATHEVTDVTRLVDEVEQVVEGSRTVEREGEVVREASFRIALIPKRQFELLFEATGWSDWRVYSGFDRQPLADASQEMVWIAEK